MGVVGHRRQITWRLLGITQIAVMVGSRDVTGIAGHGVGKFDTRIQRTDEDRLPTSTREARHRDSFGIGGRMRQEDIQSTFQ